MLLTGGRTLTRSHGWEKTPEGLLTGLQQPQSAGANYLRQCPGANRLIREPYSNDFLQEWHAFNPLRITSSHRGRVVTWLLRFLGGFVEV
jgi:hypothetical protein